MTRKMKLLVMMFQSVPDTVQHSPPVSQSDLQHEEDVDLPIALRRSKRSCGPTNRLI